MPLLRRLMAGAMIAATAVLSPALADVRAGVEAWQNGNYPAAVREWRPLAEKGDADAQFNLGQAYKLGRGVPADLKTAQGWYEKAAKQDHEEAQANLGLILFQNGQQEAGMVWIRKASDNGDPRARYILATALFNGDMMAKDWPRAYALMNRAAAQGLAAATNSLAQIENVIAESERQQGMDIARDMARQDAEREVAAARAAPAGSVAAPGEAPRKAAAAPTQVARSSPPPQKAAPKLVTSAPVPTIAASPTPKPVEVASAVPPRKASAPKPSSTSASPSLTSGGGRWRVQLGAYGSVDLAKGQWAILRKKNGVLAGLQPSYEPFGGLTRLRVNALADRSAAEKVCAAARSVGHACFAIAP